MLRTAPRTHTRAHTHSHSRAFAPTHTRLAPAPTAPPRRRRRVPNRLFDSAIFFFFFLIFNLPLLGFPPCNGESKHFSRQDLSGVVGSSCGEERGHAGLASPSRLFRQAAAGARVPGGARVRAEAVGPCLRGAPRASRPAPGAPAWPPPPWPCCLREGSLLCALGSTRNVGGAPCVALPLPPTFPLLLGPHRGMGCLWEFGAARRWGPVLGRPRLTHRGGGRSGECSLLLGAPQTECRQTGQQSVGVRLPKFIPASLLPTHASPAPPRNL